METSALGGGIARVIAADGKSALGGSPTLAILDERAAWESVFDARRSAALEARLANLPAHERQRRRHALFRALEPRLMTPATEERHDFRELLADTGPLRERLDALLREL